METEIQKKLIELIQQEYIDSRNDWYIGYSGGKDSTALLILTLCAIRDIPVNANCTIHVVYCDTGVEFPMISHSVKRQFHDLEEELQSRYCDKLSFEIKSPAVKERFFSMVIGKGYVPPTFLFRWCTRRLRIKPLQQELGDKTAISTILLGIRNGESNARDRVISRRKIDQYYTTQDGYPNSKIFCPIIDLSVEDVWTIICESDYPKSIDRTGIKHLYSCVGTEFSDDGIYLRDVKRGRFGCWTCTVVDKDHAMEGLIRHGHKELCPLNEFMIWLKSIRNDPNRRGRNRINGKEGKGPFTLQARKEIFYKLIEAENKSGIELLSPEERAFIIESLNLPL